MRVAIIGTGVSGLAAIRICIEYGLEPIAFEKSDNFGGLWRYRQDAIVAGSFDIEFGSKYLLADGTVMAITISNTSKEMNAYSDFPPPADFPNFWHHTKMIEYLQLYVDLHRLESYIRYKHTVNNIMRSEDFDETGRFIVHYSDHSTE